MRLRALTSAALTAAALTLAGGDIASASAATDHTLTTSHQAATQPLHPHKDKGGLLGGVLLPGIL